jgi:hypothetical protein
MFGYGIPVAKAKEIYPEAYFFDSSVRLGQLVMANFPGDCGALLFTGCNYATPTELKAAMEIASLAGMSKIFGTIVLRDESDALAQKDIFVNEGFQVIADGWSNRTPTKKDIVLFHYNTNPKKKGY